MNHCKSLGLVLLGAVATLLTPAMAQGQEKNNPPNKKTIRAIKLSATGSSRKPPTQAELDAHAAVPYPTIVLDSAASTPKRNGGSS